MFEEALQNLHRFSVVRRGTDFFLKKTEDLKPDEESHLFSGSHRDARCLWSRLVRSTGRDYMLQLSKEETAFLLVLLCEEETIKKRMEELSYPIDQIDLEKLIGKVRKLSWDFIQGEQK